MRFFTIILSLFFISSFSGCYTRILTEEDNVDLAEQEEAKDTVKYIYFPQDKFIPISGPESVAQNPVLPTTEDVAPQPQAMFQWPASFYQVMVSVIQNPEPVNEAIETESCYYPVGNTQAATTMTKTVTTAPRTNVWRTSGVQRTGSNTTQQDVRDNSRNSGVVRGGDRNGSDQKSPDNSHVAVPNRENAGTQTSIPQRGSEDNSVKGRQGGR